MVREEVIRELIKGKDVLDIGSVGQTDKYSLWQLYDGCGAKSITGIDLPTAHESAVKTFNIDDKNVNADKRIVYGNMEDYKFDRQFDVIIAGDVLEHVENQGLFLRNIKAHLKKDGVLVLTTPNAKWPTVFLKPNPTHALWHDVFTLGRILSMAGLKVQELKYYPGNKKNYNPLLRLLLARQAILVVASADGA